MIESRNSNLWLARVMVDTSKPQPVIFLHVFDDALNCYFAQSTEDEMDMDMFYATTDACCVVHCAKPDIKVYMGVYSGQLRIKTVDNIWEFGISDTNNLIELLEV